ncbi:undecaprenyldiphospho-muramoylpentapeptide beta-N-acetylglucosaminyltransferase [Bacillus gaemokensis]|uniref:UDP-N-acetylglucosamine--N-acetylmuramyl-(pentapeptide) pyrophosphoryl-undecaprenol N-acetylglucosamine transferase n=1 Tax=Bacillus gaemokensis TaxID=574375 RepID=A0A073K944_9BACI|nr:undecaprenyldiphospho-muramoylpentapeptide beta-N-acetylglucosaminyltransferase [Bacillus gaemokensis]KEK22942.1 UDP-diphospho-muramoylpentapeptide beta-N- acetylglucosaminyltransferase [Bacillus gaemokensis]KYG37514.1 UDP-N-acetylglucosamine--N-acetylmuramyl-(pentapeptide) pyrophosphoryl-undecaprenol N-acetylglucosamine transferase [Bacillus gaemokensis]
MNKKVVFTGGGTAGHVMVNVALIPKFLERGWDIQYIGSQNGIEKTLITDVKYHSIATGKFRRYWDWDNVKDPFKVIKGSLQSYKLIKKMRPDVVFSAGGFVSVPVVIGAWLNKVPIIIREPDRTLGLANKIAIPFAKKVCTTFPDTAEKINTAKTQYIGPIVREEIKKGDALRGLSYCKFKTSKPILLVMGGSQGAQSINDTVRACLENLLKDFNVVHICGKGKLDSGIHVEGYKQFEYIGERLPDILALAHIVVSRAGSTAIFELKTLKKPMLLLPLSNQSSRGDQIINTEHFESLGYAEVLLQENIDADTFLHKVYKLLENKDKYIQNMSKNVEDREGIDELVDVISEVTIK